MSLRPVHAEVRAQAVPADARMIRLEGDGVVPERAILHERVRDVDPEPGDAPVEPEPHDVVEGIGDLRVPPVQVRLFAGGSCGGRTGPCRRPRSRRGRRRTIASCWAASRRARRPPRRTSRDARPTGSSARPTNHGCRSLVWLGTRSISTRMPRSAASATRRSRSSMRPEVGIDIGVVRDVVAPVRVAGRG